MPIWRLQVEFQLDSALPRDALTITPHFNDVGLGTDPDGLCEDLATALNAKSGQPNTEIRVTAYDAQGTPPVLPQGSAIRAKGVYASSTVPRELALCLSYYSGENRHRRRGRLYIPAQFCLASAAAGKTPSGAQRAACLSYVDIFKNLGGTDVDWCVYSRADDQAYSISHAWCDDEWDTVRSRGLRATTRDVVAVGE
jgi:hypothetical protein